jgi:prophage DNA circulation protein
MLKQDARESTPIVQRLAKNLSKVLPPSGDASVNGRIVSGEIQAGAYQLLITDTLGPPLTNLFDLVRQSGATFNQMEIVRAEVQSETPHSLGAVLTVNNATYLCLATEGQIVADMIFVSRTDVEAVQLAVNAAFSNPEEIAADDQDSRMFQALFALHAAITNHLVVTARPLPRLVEYQFAKVMSTLVLSHRLYGDASRADEIRSENKIVHPLFCPLQGVALSQ